MLRPRTDCEEVSLHDGQGEVCVEVRFGSHGQVLSEVVIVGRSEVSLEVRDKFVWRSGDVFSWSAGG